MLFYKKNRQKPAFRNITIKKWGLPLHPTEGEQGSGQKFMKKQRNDSS